MQMLYALVAGIVFGAGLTVSDMVNPARVLNFLDVAGNWDPTLLFVMAGGLAVTAIGYRFVFRRSACVVGDQFNLPGQQQVELRLVGGAALFGIGWGCRHLPGPGANGSRYARAKSTTVCRSHAGWNDWSELLASEGGRDESTAGPQLAAAQLLAGAT
jgi:uncharacterized protein